MPITAWYCRGCRAEVSLDHFATTPCGETVCHPDYAAALLADRAGQPSGVVRVTHGLGCPRRAAIEQSEGYTMDPLDSLASMSGIGWHLLMEKGSSGHAEKKIRIEIDGVSIAGSVDRPRISCGELIVEDWKTTSDYQFSKKEAPWVDHIAQLSVYGKALGAKRAIVWYKAHKGMMPVKVDLMEIEDVLEIHPHDGDHTVRELYHQADDWTSGRLAWRDLPLAGQSMKFGTKSACDYCAVRETCTIAAMGAPF